MNIVIKGYRKVIRSTRLVDAVKDKTLTLNMRYSTNVIIKMKLNSKPYGNVILTFFLDVVVCMSCDESSSVHFH